MWLTLQLSHSVTWSPITPLLSCPAVIEIQLLRSVLVAGDVIAGDGGCWAWGLREARVFHVSDPETRVADRLLQGFSSGDPGAVLSLETGGSDALSRGLCVLGLFCCHYPWPQVLHVYVGRGGGSVPHFQRGRLSTSLKMIHEVRKAIGLT